jgi:hypothetical protein
MDANALIASSRGYFSTERLPLAIYLHASGRLHFLECVGAAPGKVSFIFQDPANAGNQIELEFENGAEVAANSLFASQKYLRRKMTETLRSTEYDAYRR